MALAPTTSVGGAGGGSTLLFYAEVTSGVTTTSIVEASAELLVSLGAQTYTAVPTWIEFYCGGVAGSASGACVATLWDGGTELCRIGDIRTSTGNNGGSMLARVKLTPTAASHTYLIRGFGINSILWNAGTGSGGATLYAPMYVAAYTA